MLLQVESPVELDWSLAPRAALGVLALLCGNGYIVGINQVYDVDIDAINKPFLPVAAGVWFHHDHKAQNSVSNNRALTTKQYIPALTSMPRTLSLI